MEKARITTDPVLRRIKSSTPFLLALALVISGFYELYKLYVSDQTDNFGFVDDILAAVIKIIMAEFILFDPKRNVLRAVGFYALSIGMSRVILSISTLMVVSTISLVIGSITLIMGVNLLFSSYKYLMDTSRGLLSMIASTSGLALLEVVLLLVNYQTYLMTGVPLYADVAPNIISLFLYLILLLILDTEEARYNTELQQINTRIESVRVMNMAENSLKLSREDGLVLKHMFDDRSSWNTLADGGPVESEKRLVLVDERVKSVMILQKWSGHDNIYVTMSNDKRGSVMIANRFSITDVYSDGDDNDFTSLRMYDGKRMLMCLEVEPLIPSRKGATA